MTVRPLFVVLIALLLPAAAPAADPPAAGSAPADSTEEPQLFIFAVEDTAKLPALFQATPTRVRANRIGIREIVDRCIAHEDSVRGAIDRHDFTLLTRSILYVGGEDAAAKRRLVMESADRYFFRRPDQSRVIPLKKATYALNPSGERSEWEPDDGGAVHISFEDLDELPFYLEDRDRYDFEIVSRKIVGNRVIYEVDLEPKSDFEIAPRGRIWIDSSAFRILREEFDFGDRVPLPMFVKRVGPFVRERERIGDVWVWKRFLVRIDLRMGYLRWLDEDIPDRVEMALTFQDHAINDDAAAELPERGDSR